MFKIGDKAKNKQTGQMFDVIGIRESDGFLLFKGYSNSGYFDCDAFRCFRLEGQKECEVSDNPFITHVPAHTKIDKAPVISFFDHSLFFCDPKNKSITLRGPQRGQQVSVEDLREFAKKINQLADALEMVG